MSSWDGKVCQLRRTSLSKGGCLHCQERGPGRGKRMALSIPKEAGEGQRARGTRGANHGRPGGGEGGQDGGYCAGGGRGRSGGDGDGGVEGGRLCFLLSFVRRFMGRRSTGIAHYNRASWFGVGKVFFIKIRRCHGPPGRM